MTIRTGLRRCGQRRPPPIRPPITSSFIGPLSIPGSPMLGLMKRDLVVAGKAIGGAGLTGAVLYLVQGSGVFRECPLLS
jgi:hypothetical protein